MSPQDKVLLTRGRLGSRLESLSSMKSELVLKFEFKASHSLAGYEAPHSHLWKLETAIGGEVIDGKIADMMEVRAQIDCILGHLTATFLNENPYVGQAVRKAPTCETLGVFFKDKLEEVLSVFRKGNSSIYLGSVMVTICSDEGLEIGGVRLTV